MTCMKWSSRIPMSRRFSKPTSRSEKRRWKPPSRNTRTPSVSSKKANPRPLLNCHAQASACQNGGNLLALLAGPLIDFRGSDVVDSIGELKRALGSHLGDGLAEQINHLLVGMAVTIVDDDASAEFVINPGVRLFNRLRQRGCGKCGHRLFYCITRAAGTSAGRYDLAP